MHSSLILLNDPIIFSVTLSQLIYFFVAILVGIIAETIIGWRLPYGILGAILCATIGIAILVALPIKIGNEVSLFGLQIAFTKAFVGGILLTTIWHISTYSHWRRRHRYYRGHRDRDERRYADER
jgi:uncharacterized membrane protein YeaQ/YmgE (transglycosylase-associated protein family)